MPVLFRTIYACGLRASEARLLRFDDVDLVRDTPNDQDVSYIPRSRPAQHMRPSITTEAKSAEIRQVDAARTRRGLHDRVLFI
jgi:hypothetical protein